MENNTTPLEDIGGVPAEQLSFRAEINKYIFELNDVRRRLKVRILSKNSNSGMLLPEVFDPFREVFFGLVDLTCDFTFDQRFNEDFRAWENEVFDYKSREKFEYVKRGIELSFQYQEILKVVGLFTLDEAIMRPPFEVIRRQDNGTR